MAIDIREIELTDEQRQRIAQLAEQSGRAWEDVLNERLETATPMAVPAQYLSFADNYIRDAKKRLEHFRRWTAVAESYNPNFDDSRESIYPDRT
jgi:hypothetical protein